MALEFKLYPLSSTQGKAIPLEVIKPVGHFTTEFTPQAMVAPLQFTTLDIETIMLLVFSSTDVVLDFDSVTPINDITSGLFYLPALTLTQMYLPSQHISAIGYGSGRLHINIVELWDTLDVESQNENG